ncbi:hypothetical protein DP904_23465 [Escherichia coli O8]|nr:hypothetical protein [Escherichia coli O8]
MHMIKTIMVAALAVSQVSFGANAANQGGGRLHLRGILLMLRAVLLLNLPTRLSIWGLFLTQRFVMALHK